MEMTGSHEILIPLMATAFFATGTSKLINPVPLYRALCNSYIQPAKQVIKDEENINGS
jgi:H+/Cl- antiporter ClcA